MKTFHLLTTRSIITLAPLKRKLISLVGSFRKPDKNLILLEYMCHFGDIIHWKSINRNIEKQNNTYLLSVVISTLFVVERWGQTYKLFPWKFLVIVFHTIENWYIPQLSLRTYMFEGGCVHTVWNDYFWLQCCRPGLN